MGGLSYTCAPKAEMGERINDMTLSDGTLLDPSKKYMVGGWASVNPDTEGPAIYDLLENYISRKEVIIPKGDSSVKVVGM